MIGRVLRILFLGGLAAALVSAAFALGMSSSFMLRPNVPIPEHVTAPANFAIYGEVWRHVDREYYGGRPEAEQITRGAIEGLVAALEDPWAMLAPTEVTDPAWLAPRYVPAVEAWVEPVTQGARVLSVVPGGSADEAGLQGGDLLVSAEPMVVADAEGDGAVEEEEDEGAPSGLFQPAEEELPLADVLERIRGPHTLILLRSGMAALQLEIEPKVAGASPPAPVIEALGAGGVYVQPVTLDDVGVAALVEALDQHSQAGDAAGLVLDLRDVPGGDLEALATAAGLFSEGVMWLEDGASERTTEIEATPPGRGGLRFEGDAPLIVLINGGTVAEAEMLAAALQEVAGATLVGDASFGRATRSEVQRFEDGTLLRLSIGTWRTPGGLSVAEEGLAPNEAVSDRDAQREAAVLLAAGEPLPESGAEAETKDAGAGGG